MSDIKRTDVAEKDLFGDISKSAKDADVNVKGLEATLEMITATAKKLKGGIGISSPKTNEELKKQNQQVTEANILAQESIKLDNQLIKAKAKQQVTSKKFREELAKTRLENSRLNKEAKQSAELQDAATGAYRRSTIRLAELKRELKDASIAGDRNEESVRDLREEYDKLNKEIRQTDQELGDFQRNVGDYNSAFDSIGENVGGLGESLGGAIGDKGGGGLGGLGSAITGVVGKLGPYGAAVGAAVAGAVALTDAVVDLDLEFDTLRGTIAQLTGEEGQALDSLTASIKAFETTFGAETNESLRATNVLMKEFGISGQEAAALIEQGFLSNANIQGDLLEGVTEYSTQIKAAGGDAGDLFKILDASGTAGVFSDKGIDTVKEFGLRIREQTTATSEALQLGFGEQFTNDLFKGINEGSLSTIEALQLVTEQLEATDLSAKQRQTIIADVFGGAGEDAGSFLKTLTEINFETEFAADLSGTLAIQKQKEFEANERLADAQNRLSKSIGDSSEIGRLFTNIQTLLVNQLIRGIDAVEIFVDALGRLKTDPIDALKTIANGIKDFLLIPLRFTIFEFNLLLDLFSDFQIPDFDLNLPTKALTEFNAELRESNRVTRIASRRIEELESATIALVGAEESRVQSLVDGNLSQEERNDLIASLNEKYPELIENYDLENLSQEDAIKLQK